VSAAPFLLATRSAGKLRELRPFFAESGFEVIDLNEAGLPERAEEHSLEAFATFEENALAKARCFFERSGGMTTIADDSGLEVEALGGAPGVLSKRWSGRADLTGPELDSANNAHLLEALAGELNRRARYVCVAALVARSTEVVERGVATGMILDRPRGEAGFGYDPYFFSDELHATFAEVDRQTKERVSHRGRAFRALLDALPNERPRG